MMKTKIWFATPSRMKSQIYRKKINYNHLRSGVIYGDSHRMPMMTLETEWRRKRVKSVIFWLVFPFPKWLLLESGGKTLENFQKQHVSGFTWDENIFNYFRKISNNSVSVSQLTKHYLVKNGECVCLHEYKHLSQNLRILKNKIIACKLSKLTKSDQLIFKCITLVL